MSGVLDKYAAQVLSRSVSNVLNEWGPPGAKETAKFCRMIDSFFDLLNVRCLDEGKLKGKPFLRPFDEINNIRFDWLKRTENPDLQEYMYNANTIRVQKEVLLTSGNTRGRYDRKQSWVYTTDDIVKKRKRSSKQSKTQENLSKIKF